MKYDMESPMGARTRINGRERDYFAGCGYLGLQSHAEVLAAAQKALQCYGLSTATSRGGYGEHPVYVELEHEARVFFEAERILYFATGYLGMNILVKGTRKRFTHIFIDESAHYSVWDAAQAVSLPITAFRHCDVEHLTECMRRELKLSDRPLIVSDGVFPVSGEIAPVLSYLRLAENYEGFVYLDDAHAVGVLGEHGRGTLEHYGIQSELCHVVCTLSKALGGHGGVIAGRSSWIEEIEQESKVYIGSSPTPLSIAAASGRALAIARQHPELRRRLLANISQMRSGLRALGWSLPSSPSPIVCLPVRQDVDLARIQAGLFERDICVAHVRSYSSTPPGGALRIAVFATHTQEQIERLLGELGRLL